MRNGLWAWEPQGLSGSVHSLREEVAQFLTYYCKAPAQLDPENVSWFPSLTCHLTGRLYSSGTLLHLLEGTGRTSRDPQGQDRVKANG